LGALPLYLGDEALAWFFLLEPNQKKDIRQVLALLKQSITQHSQSEEAFAILKKN